MNIRDLVGLTTQPQTSKLTFLEQDIEGAPLVQAVDSPSPATPNASGEEFSTFLTLLTAQIRNQDPLAPLDSTQFVEQLATFTNLELQAKGNAVLEDIAMMLAQNVYSDEAVPVTDPTSKSETDVKT